MSAAKAKSPESAVGCYRDREGRERAVVVVTLAGDCWQVCEVGDGVQRRLVEEVCSDGESRASAVALARDYLRQHRGRR